MPKFLDEPSWYNSRGILLYGVGVDTNEQPFVGDVPCVHLPSGEINWRRLMVNGATSGDISIYAPTSNPTGGQILLSSGVGEPSWQDFDVNGAAIGTRSTAIYAPETTGSEGQILMSAGSGDPQWSEPTFGFVNMTFAVNGYLSSIPCWNATIAMITISCTSTSGSGSFANISLSSNEGLVIFNFPGVRSNIRHYAITPDNTIQLISTSSTTYAVSSGTFVARGFGLWF